MKLDFGYNRLVLRGGGTHMKGTRFIGSTLLAAGLLLSSPAQSQPNDSAASAKLSDAEAEKFLLEAKIIRTKGVSTGITGTRRATLSDGKLTHDASIQTVDIHKTTFQTARGVEINFRDSYKYNIAAYRLDRMLNLRMIPVSVERKVRAETAAVTWWVDDVLMLEKERFQKKIEPPDQAAWNDQIQQARIFNELVYNTDANLGNLLITKDWTLALIDFSRAFRVFKKLRAPENIANTRIDRRFYDGLARLSLETLTSKLGDVLRKSEIQGLLGRRDLIVSHFEKEIARRGEAAVICPISGH